MVPPPLHSYTQLYSSTALYTVQLYSAIHYTTYTPPLCMRDEAQYVRNMHMHMCMCMCMHM